jgi:murein L,D-transpeptidase YafK
MMIKKHLFLFLIAVFGCIAHNVNGQTDNTKAFRDLQFNSSRVADAWRQYYDSSGRDFKKRGLAWPPRDIFLRIFKWQNEMELWGRNNENTEYRLIKKFQVCAISGCSGPKRTKGDRQVPEGFYFIDEFNPKSDYLLSMKLNYPNYSDRVMGNGELGGDIYIHGGCVTIGCLPMTNEIVKEIYIICLNAVLDGQEYIPVHVYPTRLSSYGMEFLKREYPKDAVRQQFWSDLKVGYDYFEKYHKLLPVMYNANGRYVY